MDAAFWAYIVLGILMLVWGRRFFWVFVGAMGFVAGFTYGKDIFGLEYVQTLLIAASILCVIGIVIALFMQSIAIGIVGFLAGSYITYSLLPVFGEFSLEVTWLIVLIGGIVGVVLSILIIDWMLILLSSLAGAAIIVHHIFPNSWVKPVICIVLSVAGIVIQTILFLRKEKRRIKRGYSSDT